MSAKSEFCKRTGLRNRSDKKPSEPGLSAAMVLYPFLKKSSNCCVKVWQKKMRSEFSPYTFSPYEFQKAPVGPARAVSRSSVAPMTTCAKKPPGKKGYVQKLGKGGPGVSSSYTTTRRRCYSAPPGDIDNIRKFGITLQCLSNPI
jgi:hypothetical protein